MRSPTKKEENRQYSNIHHYIAKGILPANWVVIELNFALLGFASSAQPTGLRSKFYFH
ncbi:hypothetical protein COXBURSA334_1468 [Coxiella burnetii Q321]|nr:hypothetical protein COXBURSA334_1468 [Coxiella burnetii Q321]